MDTTSSQQSQNSERTEQQLEKSRQLSDKHDKLEEIMKKWQQESRKQQKEKGDQNYDFLQEPMSIIENIKFETKQYVEQQWSLNSYLQKTKNVISQFWTYYNPYNALLKDQPTFILKTRRIQYVFEKYRKIQENQVSQAQTLKEIADLQFINEIKFWATKYIMMSWVVGINLAYLSYHLAFKNLRRYVGIPLTFIVFFEGRNLLMRQVMDKVYFPIQPIYRRLRDEEKNVKPNNKVVTETSKIIDKFDLKKSQLQEKDRIIRSAEDQAQQELNQEKDQANQKLEQFIYQIHGQYINEDDFTTGGEGYQKFVNQYISLYFEPLDEEFEEERYFTREFDRYLFKKIRLNRHKKIQSIELKNQNRQLQKQQESGKDGSEKKK